MDQQRGPARHRGMRVGVTHPIYDALCNTHGVPFADCVDPDHTKCVTDTILAWGVAKPLREHTEHVSFSDARRRNRERHGPDAAEDRYRPGE